MLSVSRSSVRQWPLSLLNAKSFGPKKYTGIHNELRFLFRSLSSGGGIKRKVHCDGGTIELWQWRQRDFMHLIYGGLIQLKRKTL